MLLLALFSSLFLQSFEEFHHRIAQREGLGEIQVEPLHGERLHEAKTLNQLQLEELLFFARQYEIEDFGYVINPNYYSISDQHGEFYGASFAVDIFRGQRKTATHYCMAVPRVDKVLFTFYCANYFEAIN